MTRRQEGLADPFELDEGIPHGVQHVERLLHANSLRSESLAGRSPEASSIKLGVVGAGVMGTAISAVALQHGLKVSITDTDESVLSRAADALRPTLTDGSGVGDAFHTTTDLDAIAGCDVVLEAVLEDPAKKTEVLRALDERMPPHRLLATNTSTIPIHRLARTLRHPDRLCGTHFFLPVEERRVVEVIFTEDTSTEIRSAAIGLAAALQRHAVLAPDVVGFVVNRLMMPYVSEAMQLLTEGIEAERIERVAEAFGMPKGPLSLLDEIGLDTALDCGWVFSGAYEDRVAVSPLLVAMVKSGRLGQKSGAGFFRYSPEGNGQVKQESDPGAAEIVARWIRDETRATSEDIAARLFLPMFFEGIRILEEHKSCLAGDVDLAAVLGLGMARARGGPLFWCDQIGADRMLSIAEPFRSFGLRMEPPRSLRQMADSGRQFHGAPPHVAAQEDRR